MATLKNTTINDTENLTLPSGTTAQRPSSPAAGMIRYNTTIGDTEYYDGTAWRLISDHNPEATGGTILDTDIGGIPYRIHLFTDTGNSTFTVTKGGEVEYLIVAGGGAGGGNLGGGGGAGGVITGFTTLTAQSYTITVGIGGAGISAGQTGATSNKGGDSSAFGFTADGGGAGGGGSDGIAATTGGSAGGGGGYSAEDAIAGTPGQGNAGGKGADASNQNYRAGGGGGATQAGGDWENSSGRGGYGGSGILSSIEGRNIWYAGGGGGGSYTSNSGGGHGGLGGGGGGGTNSSSGGLGGKGRADGKDGQHSADSAASAIPKGGDAGPNTGSGGGGPGHQTALSGSGGSGIVVVRYRRDKSAESNIAPNKIVKSVLPSTQEFSLENPAPSARYITDLGLGSGWYWVDLNGPKWVYVNVEFNGGGWYLVIQNNSGRGGIGTINYVDAINYRQFYKTSAGIDSRETGFGSKNNLKEFNLWTGMKLWEMMTGGPGTGGEIAQIVYNKPTTLDGDYSKRATWTYTGFGSRYEWQGAANVSSTSDNPGLYSYHAVNGYALTTHDNDQDDYGSNCSNLYGGHPMWFGACWSGNVWGSTAGGYADAYFWTGSGSDYYTYGAVYVRALQ